MRKSIATMALGLALLAGTIPARAGDDELRGHQIKHVLLISVDGLHSLDVENYSAATQSRLAMRGRLLFPILSLDCWRS